MIKPNYFSRVPIPALAAVILAALLFPACMWMVPVGSPAMDQRLKSMSPPPGKALIYVIRAVTPAASEVRTRVYLDGDGFGTVKGGTYLALAVNPGTHRIHTSLHTKAQVTIAAKAGQTYYILHGMKAPGQGQQVSYQPQLKMISAKEGQAALAKCRPSLKNDLMDSVK